MTRAPVVRFGCSKRAADFKFFLEDPKNFDTLVVIFNRCSRFGRLQSIKCAIAGKNLYLRFTCRIGDAMGINMVSKGVQNVLDFFQSDFHDMDVLGTSGNFCSDKKPAAVTWIEGREKSVVCEVVIKEEVVIMVLKTTVPTLVELNMLKNLTGSAMVGVLGGFIENAKSSSLRIFSTHNLFELLSIGIHFLQQYNSTVLFEISFYFPEILNGEETSEGEGVTTHPPRDACLYS